jgi:hypothetical protein
MTDSVRLICLKFMRDQLSAIAAPDFSLSMSTALLGPIADGASRRRFSVGVVPGKEMVEDRFPLTECILPVVVEFQITTPETRGPPSRNQRYRTGTSR